MKTLLRALAVLAVLSVPLSAEAGWNLKQKSDGTTVWVNPDGIEIGVGGVYLTVNITNMADPATAYIVSPVPGIIREVMSILGDGGPVTTGGANVVSLQTALAASMDGSDGTPALGNFSPLTGWTTVNMTIAQGSSVAQTDTMGLRSYATPASLINNEVERGGVIAVNTDGGNSDAREMTVIITIDPK